MARLRKANGVWRPVLDSGLLGAPVPEPSAEEKDLSTVQAAALGLGVRRATLPGGEACPCCGARLEYLENRRCEKCGNEFWEEGEEEVAPAKRVQSPEAARRFAQLAEGAVVLKPGQLEYRVVTQADQWFMGKFSPERLSVLLNQLSAEGWRVIAVTAADRGTWFGSFGAATRQEIVVFLERPVTQETLVQPGESTLADRL